MIDKSSFSCGLQLDVETQGISAIRGFVSVSRNYLQAVNAFYLLLQSRINEAVLLDNGQSFEGGARDSDSIETSATPCTRIRSTLNYRLKRYQIYPVLAT